MTAWTSFSAACEAPPFRQPHPSVARNAAIVRTAPSFPPRKRSGKQHQSQLGSHLRPMRFDPALHVQSQLLVEEEIPSGQSPPRPQTDPDEAQGIPQKIEHGQQHVGQKVEFRHRRHDRIPRTLSSLKGVNRGGRNYCGQPPRHMYRNFDGRRQPSVLFPAVRRDESDDDKIESSREGLRELLWQWLGYLRLGRRKLMGSL